MSETVRSYGFVAALKEPVPKEQQEALSEKMYEERSKVMFTEHGLVFIDYNSQAEERHDYHGLWIGNSDKDPDDLVREAYKYGLEVDQWTIMPYNCVWYNGGDCPLWTMKRSTFLQIKKDERS